MDVKLTNEEIINLVIETESEDIKGWQDFVNEAEEDHQFYANDSWSDKDISSANKKGIDVYKNNICDKPVNAIVGHALQNRFDLSATPVETEDFLNTEVLSMCLKHVQYVSKTSHEMATAFKQAAIAGMGWIHLRMDYGKDYFDGNVCAESISLFEVIPDPFFRNNDLSDCAHIRRIVYTSKSRLKSMFPKYAKEINAIGEDGSIQRSPFPLTEGYSPPIKNDLIKVCDYYFKEWETTTKLMNPEDLSKSMDWNDETKSKMKGMMGDLAEDISDEDMMNEYATQQNLKPITRSRCKIYYHTVIADKILVTKYAKGYSDEFFPFIPLFGVYDKHNPGGWDKKLFGIIRPIKDQQRLTNVSMAQFIYNQGTRMKGGWEVPKGSVDDINVLRNASGYDQTYEYNVTVGKPTQIQAPPIDPGAIQLLQISKDDAITRINADLMGMTEGGSGKSAPGITLELRTRQAMKMFQEIFTHFTEANELLGKHLSEIILTKFSKEKIKRILGSDLPFEKHRKEIGLKLESLEDQEVLARQNFETQTKAFREQIQDVNMDNVVQLEQQAQQLEQQKAAFEQQMDLEYRTLENQLKTVDKEEERFWKEFDNFRKGKNYDCRVIEIPYSPTSRITAREELLQIAQYGQDPVLQEIFIGLMDIPQSIKDQYLNRKSEMQQQAAQAQQQQMDMQQRAQQQNDSVQQQQLELQKLAIQVKALEKMPDNTSEKKAVQ